jgi:hypothetical protein
LIEVIPPPAPASAPQENCPLLQSNLSDEFAQAERPAPVKVLAMFTLVLVAFVLVLLRKVTFWRVDDPVTRRLASVPNP